MDLSALEVIGGVSAVDPNALLVALKDAARDTLSALDDPDQADTVTANEASMAEKILQLDDWMARGGFSPHAWQQDAE